MQHDVEAKMMTQSPDRTAALSRLHSRPRDSNGPDNGASGDFDASDTLVDPPVLAVGPAVGCLVVVDDLDTLVDRPSGVFESDAEAVAPVSTAEESRLTKATAELLARYRFRRLEGHQAGCQCQSRADRVGCIDLRARLLAAGLWDVLYASTVGRLADGRREGA